MVRILLAVLAWPAVILIAIWMFEWLDEYYLNPKDQDAEPFQYDHPKYHSMAREALLKYSQLPAAEQAAFKTDLQKQLITVEQWTGGLDHEGFSILCVGEDHLDVTRNFLAVELFSNIDVDVLLLEATQSETLSILRRIESGQATVDLQGADIAAVVRAARKSNPGAMVRGIEETATQKRQRLEQEQAGIRDDSIAANVWADFRLGQRHAILFGAIHCNNWSNWLYQRLRQDAPQQVLSGMLNVRVVERKQDSLIDPFLFFLDEIGIEQRDFVIEDTGVLDPLLLEWFALMVPQIFSQYKTLVIYRDE